MTNLRKALLITEVSVCFSPAAIGLLMTALGLLGMFWIGEAEGVWRARFEASLFLLAGGAHVLYLGRSYFKR
jgi:hypothetical protein